MWEKVKIKRGALSILLILGLVLTNLSPLGSWAGNTEKNYLDIVTKVLTPTFGNPSADIANTLLKVTMEDKREELVAILTEALEVKEEQKPEEKAQPGDSGLSIPEPPRAQAQPVAVSNSVSKRLGEDSLKKLLSIMKADADIDEVMSVINALKADDVDADKLISGYIEETIKKGQNVEDTPKVLEWKDSYLSSRVVEQEGKTSNDETIDPNKDFIIKAVVKLPVNPVEGVNRAYLKKGDKIRVPLGKGIKLHKDNADYNENLSAGIEVGKKPLDNVFNARSVIEGDAIFMDMTLLRENSELNNAVNMEAEMILKFSVNTDKIEEDKDGKYITVLEKRYRFEKDVEARLQMEKSGKIDFNTGYINWEVKIENIGENGTLLPLDSNYKFEDPLKNVGKFVDGSFSIHEVKPDGTAGTELTVKNENLKFEPSTKDINNEALTYIFPDNTTGKVIIKFSTSLQDGEKAKSFSRLCEDKKGFNITNIAYLYQKEGDNYGKKLIEAEKNIKWSGRWGAKYHGKSIKKGVIGDLINNELKEQKVNITTITAIAAGDDSSKDYIKGDKYEVQWNIVFDATGKNLKNVRIEDRFPRIGNDSKKELKISKATIRYWDNGSKAWTNPTDITEYFSKDPYVYNIGDLNTLIKVTVWSEIGKDEFTGSDRFGNAAFITWNDGKQVKLEDNLDLGTSLMYKRPDDAPDHQGNKLIDANPTWYIKVKKNFVNENKAKGRAYVYDAVIYGNDREGLTVDKEYLTDDGKLVSSKIALDRVLEKVSDRKMVYEKGSQKGIGEPKIYTLKFKGEPVGDLLEFDLSTLDGSVNGWNDYYRFSFRTHLVDGYRITGGPKNGANGNQSNEIKNLAWLVKGAEPGKDGAEPKLAERIQSADSWPGYNHRMIQKDALTSEAAEKIIEGNYDVANANSIIEHEKTDGAYAKNYKSIIYRLSVNAAGVKSFINDKNYMNALIEDSIDSKFERVKISDNGLDYLVYSGEARTKTIPSDDAFVDALGSSYSKDEVDGLFKAETAKTDNKSNARLTFKKLEKPYVILYRVKLADSEVKKNTDKDSTVHNTAAFSAWNKKGEEGKYKMPSSKIVAYDSRFLGKDYITEEGGVIRWTINYKPSVMDKKTKEKLDDSKGDIELYDELGEGLSAFVDKDGKTPIFNGIAHVLTKVDDKGKVLKTYTDAELKTMLTYKKVNNKDSLTLKIPAAEKNNNFIFSYSTTLAKDKAVGPENVIQLRISTSEKIAEGSRQYKIETGVTLRPQFITGNKVDIVLKKLDEDTKEPLSGVKFKLEKYNTKTNLLSENPVELVTDKDGRIVFQDLTVTKEDEVYAVTELAPTEGYINDGSEYRFTLGYGQTADGIGLIINKAVQKDGKDVNGILQSDSRTIVVTNKKGKKDEDKKSNFSFYKVKKVEEKDNVKEIADAFDDKNGSEKQGLATLNKYLLSGARFVLKNATTGEVIPVKDNNGVYTATKNLVKGSYTLQELKAPKGYQADASRIYHFDFTPDQKDPKVKGKVDYHGFYDSKHTEKKENDKYKANNYLYKYLVIYNEKDTRPVADLTVVKQDITDKTALAGAEFELVYPNGITTEGAITSATGSAVFKDLVAGTYKLKETKAPSGYNKLEKEYLITITPGAVASTAVEIVVEKDVKYISVVDGKVVVFNEKQNTSAEPTYDLELIKTDLVEKANMEKAGATEGAIKARLSGVGFRLTNPSGNAIIATTNAVGVLRFEGLKEGIYELKELAAPKGYTGYLENITLKIFPGMPHGERVQIVNDEARQNDIQFFDNKVVVFNKKVSAEPICDLNLLKADIADNAATTLGAIKTPLDGARFRLALASDSAVSYSAVTGENASKGSIKFTGLKSGTYVLTEEAAPTGYNPVTTGYAIVVTASAVTSEFEIKNPQAGEIRELEGNVVVFNKKIPDQPSGGGGNPGPGPSPNPNPSPNPSPNPNPPTPTTELPRYPENDFPDPNDPYSPDEFVAVDEDGTPQGKYVKSKKPDGTEEYIPVDEDETPLGVNKAKKKLPKTGGSDTTVYYVGGAILLILAAGVVVFRRKKHNE